ncbi:hypothetical protein DFH11DRAFT_1686607 [Phellopilus nigrolimitatus]|nr:hypothetical protein DFH11DRAFT_1686607 [Phellopilus nigrolimitatus]
MFNNSYQTHDLAIQLEGLSTGSRKSQPRRNLCSDPCLLSRLPSSSFIQREGERSGPREILRQLRRSPSPPSSPHVEEEVSHGRERRASTSSSIASEGSSSRKAWFSPKAAKSATGPWKEPQSYEIFRAIERKDIMFLMEVRDRAFHLLLKKTGDATPLVHAMRIGESHRDISIILLGAMSKWVNHLEDSDMADKRTKPLLKALRTNLKLAIDYGLQRSQSDLIASFMQTLIMSEGDRWVTNQAHNIALALRAGTEGKPVHTAETAVRSFATKELGKADLIAALEDYVSNATADLLLLAAWSCVLDSVQGDPIPTYYFARDDRVFKAFQERVYRHRTDIAGTSKRLRWQMRVLGKALEGRTTTYRSKIELLAEELDEGPGV